VLSPIADPLTDRDVLARRMAGLLLRPADRGVAGGHTDVAGVVEWMGAMQAQDVASGLWSLGVRLPGFTRTDVVAALERREALRTWPMRGTVHLVPARDARWMVELTGRRALAGAARRRAALGLDDAVADRAVDVLGSALAGGGRLTRPECLAVLERAGIPVTGQLGYHLLWYASQRGVTCIAPNVGAQQSFVLLDEWAPGQHRPSREEGLATLAVRYFRSHGPAPRHDFAGWTGLTAADVAAAVRAAGEALVTVRHGERHLVAAAGQRQPEPLAGDEVLVLPGYDEYLLGFKDRSLMLAEAHRQAIVPGGNGVFQPTVVRAGRVVGTWRRTARAARTVVQVRALERLGRSDRAAVERRFAGYARYLAQPVDVGWADTVPA
jgi:hypothetical protein